MKEITVTQEEILIILSWFNAYRKEVDIDTDSYVLFTNKIAPSLPDEIREGTIYNIDQQYLKQ